MSSFFEEGLGNKAKSLWGSGVEGATGLLSSGINQAKKLGHTVGIGDESDSAFQFNTDKQNQASPVSRGSYTPTTSFGGYGTEGAFSNYFKPSSLSQPGLSAADMGKKEAATLDFGLPTDYAGMKELSDKEGGFDFEGLAKTLQSIKSTGGTPPISMTRTGGGSGRYDKSVFENPLLTRERNALYSAPLYTPLT